MRSNAQLAGRPARGSLVEEVQSMVKQSPAAAVSLYRLPQVLTRIPVSKSSWFAGIQSGRYPKGYNLGPRTTVWRSDEIDQLISSVIEKGAVSPRTAKELGRGGQ